MKILAKLEPLRHWVDGWDAVDSAGEIVRRARLRWPSEEFMVRVAREVGDVMRREAFTPPGGTTFIPGEFVVFLSLEDDKEWCGVKRRGLEQGLAYALRQRSKDLFGSGRLNKSEFAVEFRVDGTLGKGQFRVKALWDSETAKTVVGMRDFKDRSWDDSVPFTDAEVTVVNTGPRAVLYSLAVMRDGMPQCVFPATKAEITIGRGSREVKVDLPIRGDAEVSRIHAVLARDEQGGYLLTPRGQNPVFINGCEAPRGEPARVSPGDQIRICSFILTIRSR